MFICILNVIAIRQGLQRGFSILKLKSSEMARNGSKTAKSEVNF